MTVRDLLVSKGFARPGATKAVCPFHDDATPSAHIHDDTNTIYCYACRRLYGASDFMRMFGVILDQVATGPVKSGPDHDWGEVLFYV